MKNTKGQMHVLEVLLVATLFTSTVNVAVNILPTSDANNVEEYNLYFTGLEILEVLDEWIPSDSSIAELKYPVCQMYTINLHWIRLPKFPIHSHNLFLP